MSQYSKIKANKKHFSLNTLVLLVIIGAFCLSSSNLFASHAAGGEIAYEYLGQDGQGKYRYWVSCKFYRFCGGAAAPDTLRTVRITNGSINILEEFPPKVGTGQVITGDCSHGEHNHSAYCLQEYVYEKEISLDPAAHWVIGYSVPVRNPSDVASQGNLYVEATFDNLNYPPSNSVLFNSRPNGQLCAGQPFFYNPGAELNGAGNRLEYELITPKTGPTSNVTYFSGYSASDPFGLEATFDFNTQTGELEVIPVIPQGDSDGSLITILAVRVNVFQGDEIVSSVVRDIQMNVDSCENTVPTLSGFNGGLNYSIDINGLDPICFNFKAVDPDAGQYVHVHMESEGDLAGTDYAFTYNDDPNIRTAELCWTPPASGTYRFLLNVHDDHCPVGSNVYTYTINVHTTCKTRIAFVVDESGSINGAEPEDIRAGLVSFVNQEVDKDIVMSFIGMSSSNVHNRNDYIVDLELNQANKALFDTIVARYKTPRSQANSSSDYWASGLSIVNDFSDEPDIVVVITDGQQGGPTATSEAIESLKSKGTPVHIFGISTGFYNSSMSRPIEEFLSEIIDSLVLSQSDSDLLTSDYHSLATFVGLGQEISHLPVLLEQSQVGCFSVDPPEVCDNCITSFSPFRNEKYFLSAWVKEGAGETSAAHFDNVGVLLEFTEADGTPVASFDCRPSGDIIDGWQRIEYDFVVPGDADLIDIVLKNYNNPSTGIPTFFDDIRIHPYNSNMKSFVYDPETFRLMAELDENNYATFYEYDEEGALVRVKKETERGVKTIQESRNNTVKAQ